MAKKETILAQQAAAFASTVNTGMSPLDLAVYCWMEGWKAGHRARVEANASLTKVEKDALAQIEDEEWRALMEEWLAYKKEKKQTYKTVASILACHKRMRRLSGDVLQQARANLEFSIGNGYDGFFAETQRTEPAGGTANTGVNDLFTALKVEPRMVGAPVGNGDATAKTGGTEGQHSPTLSWEEEYRAKSMAARLPEGQWKLTGADGQTLWNVLMSVKGKVSEQEYRYWIEPAACADTVDGKALIVKYYGSRYKGQNPKQNTAFLLFLDELRKAFAERIEDVKLKVES